MGSINSVSYLIGSDRVSCSCRTRNGVLMQLIIVQSIEDLPKLESMLVTEA